MKTQTIIAAAIFLTVGSVKAQSMSAAPAALPTPDYLMAAGQSDAFELQEGQLAETMATSPQIKKFGAKMVADHTKSTKMLMAAATKAGMTPTPPPLGPDQMAQVKALQATSGKDFDHMYLAQQEMAHEAALSVHKGYALGGDNPTIKATAKKIVPVVEHHIMMIKAMMAN